VLDKISNPDDLKKMPLEKLDELASEIRSIIVSTISKNGGHLSPDLGTVDLTIALHYSYSSPTDKFVWDVGHQAYAHKILTGRADKFPSIRQKGGLSGYLRLAESPHDHFGAGHAGTAVSAALGIAKGRDLNKKDFQVVAVIGDGSLTNGLTYEGINNIGQTDTDITIVLNDNSWAITKNIGGIAKYLQHLTSDNRTLSEKDSLEQIFQSLGFKYFGPIDGHNIKQMVDVFNLTKQTQGPRIIHVVTQKGRGYKPAEDRPDSFHFSNPFDPSTGLPINQSSVLTFTKTFSNTIVELARKDPKIVAITAAMQAGTGLSEFAKEFPDRFFDVGIAEEHAVVFAAGLQLQGFKPIVAIYSSFLQRSYDQIIHDVALQNLPVIFALDRSGIGTDGPTHQGTFDLSYLRTIPNLVVMAPKDKPELRNMLFAASDYKDGPISIRYPRDNSNYPEPRDELENIPIGKAEKILSGSDISILTIGTMFSPALSAAKKLESEGMTVQLFNARFVKPLDQEMIKSAAMTGKILTVEENILDGGFGSAVMEELEKLNISQVQIKRIGITDFIEHGQIEELKEQSGLTAENIYQEASELLALESLSQDVKIL
jgi:1-deoxy-D-xylulose-5-phosphate synthase